MDFNQEILRYLNNLANTNEIVKKIVETFVDFPIFLVPVFFICTWIYYTYKKENDKKDNILLIFYSCIISIIIALIIQKIVFIERPEDFLDTSKLLLKHLPDASFPSDHATVSFAFLTSLFLSGYKKIGLIFLPFATLMLLSRISAGVHWPTDIIGGILVGFFASFITFKYLKNLVFIKNMNTFIIKIMSYIKL